MNWNQHRFTKPTLFRGAKYDYVYHRLKAFYNSEHSSSLFHFTCLRKLPMLGELFDPEADVFIEERMRPHWSQAGAIVFITMRTRDSIPKSVIQRWEKEKQQWLAQRNLLNHLHWSEIVPTLAEHEQSEFKKHFNRCRETLLDECRGACVLKIPALSKIFADSFLRFDGQRYRMGDFVIMPNHAHMLVAFADEDSMKSQCDSRMHYTATQINRALNQSGKFWQQEPFDHLVRSAEQYQYLRRYIANNPQKANLQPEEFHFRRL